MKPFRRLILVLILACLISVPNGNPVSAKTVSECVNGAKIAVTTNGKRVTIKWRGKKYWTFRLRKAKIAFVSEGKLTRKQLLSRKADRIVYVVRIIGHVTDNALNGKTTRGSKIAYTSLLGRAHKGDQIMTWCVYDPFSRSDDGVIDRFDVIM